MLALSDTTPYRSIDIIKQLQSESIPKLFVESKPAGTDAMLPGASVLPASIGSKLTIRNALIGAGLAVTGYLAYAVFLAPPSKKKASTPSTITSTVAGLFGARLRHRRRRRR